MNHSFLVISLIVLNISIFSLKCFASDRIALVIGNESYQERPLNNPVNDASSIAAVLQTIGFEVVPIFNAKLASINSAIYEFGEKAEHAEIALIYYSGHAIQVDGENYLIPINAHIKKKRDLRNLVKLNIFIEEASQAKGLGVVILDACRDNPFNIELSNNLGRSIGGKGLARIESTPNNILVAFATKEDSVALDGEGNNSPYAKALLKYLSQEDLEIRLLFGKVRDEVMRNSTQQPYTYGSLGGTPWILVNSTKSAVVNPHPKEDSPITVKQKTEGRISKEKFGLFSEIYVGKGVRNIIFTSDGKNLVVGGENISIWSIDGELFKTLKINGELLGFKSNSEIAMVASGSNLYAWNTSSNKLLNKFIGHSDLITNVSFHPSTQIIASSSRDKTIRLWDLKSGDLVKNINDQYMVHSVAFSPDGKILASGSWNIIKLWDVESGKVLRELKGHKYGVWHLAYSKDGKYLISSGEDYRIKTWNVKTGELLYTHQGSQGKVEFGFMGKEFIAGGRWDQTARIWNASTGNLVRTIEGPQRDVEVVAYSPKGDKLATASQYEESIKIWNNGAE